MRLKDEDADPFELQPPPRTHQGGVSGDGLVTEATEEEAPWEFMAEGVFAQFDDSAHQVSCYLIFSSNSLSVAS